jgi:beta-lactam-binding protein with PASTA domain
MLPRLLERVLHRSALTAFLSVSVAGLSSLTPENLAAQVPAAPATRVQQPIMPDLSKLTLARAAVPLRRFQLRLVRIDTTYSSDTTGIGTIVDQKPAPRTPIRFGDTVSVTIKQYRPPPRQSFVRVPDLKGLNLRAAGETLAAHGLALDKPTIIDRYDVPFGIVFEQKPASGDTVPLKTVVSVAVASDVTIVPKLTDSAEQNAKAVLARYNLLLGDSKAVESATVRPGIILTQGPAPNTRVRKGSLVSIDVAVPPAPPPPPPNTASVATPPVTSVVVPDLTGLSLEAARDRLTGVGLLLVPRQSIRTSSVPARTIAAQQPRADSVVRRGSAVYVNLALAPFPWIPVTGGFAAGALALAAALFVTRGRRGTHKDEPPRHDPAVAEPLLEFIPRTVAIDANLRTRDLVSPYSLELVGALNEERATFDLSYDGALTKGGADD